MEASKARPLPFPFLPFERRPACRLPPNQPMNGMGTDGKTIIRRAAQLDLPFRPHPKRLRRSLSLPLWRILSLSLSLSFILRNEAGKRISFVMSLAFFSFKGLPHRHSRYWMMERARSGGQNHSQRRAALSPLNLTFVDLFSHFFGVNGPLLKREMGMAAFFFTQVDADRYAG